MNGPFSRLNRLYEKLESKPEFSYKCHFGSPITAPNYDIVGSLKLLLDEPENLFSEYPNSRCTSELKVSIFKYLSRVSDCDVVSDLDVLVTSGTREAITSVVTFAKHKKKKKSYAIVPSPCYPGYIGSCKFNDLDVFSVPLNEDNGFQPDLTGIDREILENTAIIILTNPGNPFTYYLKKETIEQVLSIAEEFDIECLIDECFFDLQVSSDLNPVSAASFFEKSRFLTIIHSLSKRSASAGLRSGFIASNKFKISEIANVRAFISPTVPNIIQQVSARLWDDELHVNNEINSINEKIKVFKDNFGNSVLYPEAGFFVNLKTEDEKNLVERLYAKGIKSMPVSFMEHSNGEFNTNKKHGYVRVGLVYGFDDIVKICSIIKGVYS
ncbi:pyridoxal phosphate-dependent aminotransferase [Aliivibrio fischeri]|uniref:pyridoxal phosphate-dependent aminotransferase n=1 Tax=Aliivibrio fischeri TaxID=668 RepID=UPI001F1F3F5E|nr:pyridoxal phosphate-dependent aminotransferase [Aliivibrio fischeri]MCE7578153.1 pyridoxal phosphate-dependent aminotransferase [Aliivibrio fischeri]MCE7590540.1 pyridoxal phosphate-dependent aminotransferase [Aliivibrio fischeri]